MEGKEIIERMKEVIAMIKLEDNGKAVLYMNYLIEDIEMYKRSSLWLNYSIGLNISGLNINVKAFGIYEWIKRRWVVFLFWYALT